MGAQWLCAQAKRGHKADSAALSSYSHKPAHIAIARLADIRFLTGDKRKTAVALEPNQRAPLREVGGSDRLLVILAL